MENQTALLSTYISLSLLVSGLALQGAQTPQYTYEIVHTYPHDPKAFTEGLFFLDGFLYESVGKQGFSDIRKVRLETGEVIQRRAVAGQYFGEGIVNWRAEIIQLTWTSHVGLVYDLKSLSAIRTFRFSGQGWSLTQDGKSIIMDDGTSEIRFWNPSTLIETGRITVTDLGQPVDYLNELEWIKGELFANIWRTDLIARINPKNGRVNGWIDCTGLLGDSDRHSRPDVLNGIAYDSTRDRIFVTGKYWPKLFEIKVIKKKQNTIGMPRK